MATENIPLLRAKEKFGYSLGDFASNLFWMTFIFYGMFFYTDVFGLPAATVGFMFLITKFWDSVNDPIMGIISDRTNTKWGKYRPYILWMFIPYGLVGLAAFSTPDLTVNGKIVYAYITYTMMMMVYTAINIPYSALMGVLTPSSKDRTSISTWRFAAAFAGGIFVQAVTIPMVSNIGGDNEDVIKVTQQENHTVQIKEIGPGTIQLKAKFEAHNPETDDWQKKMMTQFSGMFSDLKFMAETTNIWVNTPERLAEIKLSGVDNALLEMKENEEKLDGDVAKLLAQAKPIFEAHNKKIAAKLKIVETGTWPALAAGEEVNTTQTKDLICSIRSKIVKDIDVKKENQKKNDLLKAVRDGLEGMPEELKDPTKVGKNFYLPLGFANKTVNLKSLFTYESINEDMVAYCGETPAKPAVAGVATRSINYDKEMVSANPIDTQMGFQITIGFFAVISMMLWLVTFFSTKERVNPPTSKNTNVSKDLRDVVTNLPWLLVGVMGLFTLAQVCIRGGAIMYYFKYYVKDETPAAAFMLAGTIFNLVGVLATDWLTKVMGSKKKVYMIFSFLTVFTMIPFMWLSADNLLVMFILTAIGGFLSGPLSPIVWAMYADIADYSEWKKGTRATGLFFSAATFAQKMGWTIGGFLAGVLLAAYGFKANIDQSAEAITGIKALMSWIPAIGCTIAGATVIFYKLDDKFMEKVVSELEERRSKEKSAEAPA